jgi:hypothetical protein
MPLAAARMPLRTSGNAAVLVVVDWRLSEALHVPDTVFAALRHFGIPFRVHDVSTVPLVPKLLSDCALVLFAHDNLGQSLTSDEVGSVLQAVQDGLGLVSLDPLLSAYGAGYYEALGVQPSRASGFERMGVTSIGATSAKHYTNRTQAIGEEHRLNMPIPGTGLRLSGGDAEVLLETNAGAPAALAQRIGRGRVVQWLVSSRLWSRQFFGHAKGLDDVFWKAIAWAARKPFAMMPMPNFARIRLDDCGGLYRSSADLAFVDTLTRHGHKPNLCICMNALDDSGWQTLKRLHDRGLADISPHTWRAHTSLFYGDEDGEYSPKKAGKLIRETRKIMEDHRIRPSRILSDHNHECSRNALPHLHELGIEFKMNVMLPSETWEGLHRDWQPAPYGSMSFCLDTMPGEYPLFVAFTHHPNFDFCRSFLSADQFTLNRDGGFAEYGWDFLNGLTAAAAGTNSVEQMAQRLAAHTRLGINSLFFGGSVSHSHFTTALSLGEWEQLLTRVDQLTADLDVEHERYDTIAAHARARTKVDIARATATNGAMDVTLSGESEVELRLQVYADGEGDIRKQPIAPFSGTSTVTTLAG